MSIFKFLATCTMILGTLITFSSSSWLISWLGMELNLLGFIPFLLNKNNTFSKESSVKYFLIQATSSSVFIMWVSFINSPYLGQSPLNELLIFLALGMKAGVAPLHFWLLSIVDSLNWVASGSTLSWQKLAPLALMLSMVGNELFILIFMNLFIGSILMFNQVSLKKIITYSSISHSGWVIASNFISFASSMGYFLLYSLSLISLILTLSESKTYSLKQLDPIMSKVQVLIFLNLLSLGGFPPLLGFFQKFLVLNSLVGVDGYLFIPLFLVIFSLISLYIYLKLIFSVILGPSETLKSGFQKKVSSLLLLLPAMIPVCAPIYLFGLS